MTRVFNYKSAPWALVAVSVAGLFLYANRSTVASYAHFSKSVPMETQMNAGPGVNGFEPLLW